jgi:hypothetical protein
MQLCMQLGSELLHRRHIVLSIWLCKEDAQKLAISVVEAVDIKSGPTRGQCCWKEL